MDCSTPGLPVHHQLPELTHTHVHWVSDAIQPSHPLSSPSPPTFNPSQHQGLFQWVSSWHQVAKVLVSASTSVLPVNTQDWLPLGWGGWISLQSKDSQESSPAPQFKSILKGVHYQKKRVFSFWYSCYCFIRKEEGPENTIALVVGDSQSSWGPFQWP